MPAPLLAGGAAGGDSEEWRRHGRPAPSRRRALPIALIILATLVGIASVYALWAKRQLLETESWATTSEQLIQNEDVQVAVADFITTSIYENVDVSGALGGAPSAAVRSPGRTDRGSPPQRHR